MTLYSWLLLGGVLFTLLIAILIDKNKITFKRDRNNGKNNLHHKR